MKKYCRARSDQCYKVLTYLKKIFFLTVLLIAIGGFLLIFYEIFKDLLPKDNNHGIENLYFIVISCLTLLIAWIAYTKFESLINTNKNELLLRISSMFLTKEIIEARAIVNKEWIKAQLKVDKDENEQNKIKAQMEIIVPTLFNYKYIDPEGFIKLLTFLELLEDVAFHFEKRDVNDEELTDFIGGSFVYYFCVFSEIVLERRKKYEDPSYFKYLVKAIDNILKSKKQKAKSKKNEECKTPLHILASDKLDVMNEVR